MPKVLDYYRVKEPRFRNVTDDLLTRYIAKTAPDFLQDKEFRRAYESTQTVKDQAKGLGGAITRGWIGATELAPGVAIAAGAEGEPGGLAQIEAQRSARENVPLGEAQTRSESPMMPLRSQDEVLNQLRVRSEAYGPTAQLGKIGKRKEVLRQIGSVMVADAVAGIADTSKSPAQKALEYAQTEKEKFGIWLRNPIEITAGIALESLPPSVAGALGGSVVGGPGIGTAAGIGLSSSLMTGAFELLSAAEGMGYDMTDPAQVEGFIESQDFETVAPQVFTKSLVVGGVDAATAGLAGRWIGPALREGLRKTVVATGKELAMQMAGGAGGEAAGSMVAGMPVSPFDVAMEAVAELGGAPAEVFGNIRQSRAVAEEQRLRSETSARTQRLDQERETATVIEKPETGVRVVLRDSRGVPVTVYLPEATSGAEAEATAKRMNPGMQVVGWQTADGVPAEAERTPTEADSNQGYQDETGEQDDLGQGFTIPNETQAPGEPESQGVEPQARPESMPEDAGRDEANAAPIPPDVARSQFESVHTLRRQILGAVPTLANALHVVATPEEIPDRLKPSDPAILPNVDALVDRDTGDVWFVAGAFKGPDSRTKVLDKLVHEVAIHKGLRAALGEETTRNISRQVWETLKPAERDQIARRNSLDPDSDIVGEEWLAYEAERVVRSRKRPSKLWAAVASAFRQAMRALGVTMRFSDVEIARLVMKGMEAVQKPKASPVKATAAPAVQTAPSAPQEPAAPANEAPPKRRALGISNRHRFMRETDVLGPDILSFILEYGGMMSKSAALRKWGKEKFKRNRDLWDGAPRYLSNPTHNVIYGGKSTPDQIATDAHAAGLLDDATVSALWEAIETASKVRQMKTTVADAESQAIAIAEEQLVEWEKAVAAGEQGVTAGVLEVGDVLDVEGEPVKVVAVNAETGTVYLQDGRRFGRQTLQQGQVIYVEDVTPADDETEGEPMFSVSDEQFSLEMVDDETVKREQAEAKAKKKKAAQRSEMMRRLERPLTGDSSNVGAGVLFQEDADLFSPVAKAVDRELGEADRGKHEGPSLFSVQMHLPGYNPTQSEIDSLSVSYTDNAPTRTGRRGPTIQDQDSAERAFAALTRLNDEDAWKRAFAAGPVVSSIDPKKVGPAIPGFNIAGKVINGPEDAARLLMRLRSPFAETLKVILLDKNNRVLHSEVVFAGTINATEVHPTALLRMAQNFPSAKSIIISHNHPSGDPSPSSADMMTSERLTNNLPQFGLELADHIITNGNRYYSYRFRALMDIARNTPAWETVPREQLLIISASKFEELAFSLRQSSQGHAHIIYLTSRGTVAAVERVQEPDEAPRLAALGASREGAKGVIIDFGPTVGRNRAMELAQAAKTISQAVRIEFVDWSANGVISAHSAGLLNDAPLFSITEPGFYSGLQELIQTKVQGKSATVDQIKAIIREAKAEEVKWSGVLQAVDRLADDSGKVDKEKLLDYLNEEGAVRFDEGRTYSRGSRYERYQLPGGENYREVVLSGDVEEYTSNHFDDVPNYVAHMRLNDRVDADGRPGLFIEEIQSDRHQEGRKQGYQGDPIDTTGWTVRPAYKSPGTVVIVDQDGSPISYFPDLGSDAANIDYLKTERAKEDDRTPDAPFRKDWPLHMFKRALREAVETGKDWIGWTTGDTQADRYDLSKQVDAIRLEGDFEQSIEVSVARPGEGFEHLTSTTKDKLERVVGKEIAKKALDSDQREFRGVDLKVGGEGMRSFYDNLLVKAVGKYVKQWGAGVRKASMEAGVETPIWKVDITSRMRESVRDRGQPLFSVRLPDASGSYGPHDWTNQESPTGKIPRQYHGYLGVVSQGAVRGQWYANVGSVDHSEVGYAPGDDRFRYYPFAKGGVVVWNFPDQVDQDSRIAVVNWLAKRGYPVAKDEGDWSDIPARYSARMPEDPAQTQIRRIKAEAEAAEQAEAPTAIEFDPTLSKRWWHAVVRPSDVIKNYDPALFGKQLERDIRNAYRRAGVTRQIEALREQMKRAADSRIPQSLRWLITPSRVRKFSTLALPIAARLNVVGGQPGAWMFEDFDMRAGFLPTEAASGMGTGSGQTIWSSNPLAPDEMEQLIVGESITLEDGRQGYQLLRPMPAETQAKIYQEMRREWSELVFVLDQWVDPSLAKATITVGGVDIPVFNRHALARLYQDGDPFFRPQPAYTPDVAVGGGVWGALTRLLPSRSQRFDEGIRSPGRRYETGSAREAGRVRDLLTGFSVRAYQGLQEDVARGFAKDVLEASTPIPETMNGVAPEGWVKIDTAMRQLYAAFQATHMAQSEPVDLHAKPEEDTRWKAFWGAMIDKAEAMIPEQLFDAMKNRLEARAIEGVWRRIGNYWARQWKSLLLLMPDTFAENYVSNYLWTIMAAHQRFTRALIQRGPDSRKALREARALFVTGMVNLVPGMRHAFDLNHQQLFRRARETVLPDELFEGSTRLADLFVSWNDPIADQLRRGEFGSAALKGLGYGKIDIAGKQQFAFGILLARARDHVSRQNLSSEEREQAIERFVLNPPEADVRDAVEQAQRWLFNYGDTPAFLQRLYRHPASNLLVAFPLFRYHFVGREIDRATRAFRWLWKSKVQKKKMPASEKVEAMADLISWVTLPLMGYTAAEVALALGDSVIKGAFKPDDDDDDPDPDMVVGSSTVMVVDVMTGAVKRKLKARDYITSNRLNLSEIARRFGADTGDEDLWWHFKDYPIVRSAALLYKSRHDAGRYGAAAGMVTLMSGIKDMLQSLTGVGQGIKVPEKLMRSLGEAESGRPERMLSDPYATGVPLGAYLMLQLLELVPGNRQASEVIKWLDPHERKITKNQSLGYEPGPKEALQLGGVTGLLDRLARGGESPLPPKGAVNRRLGFVEAPDEISMAERLATLVGQNIKSVPRYEYEEQLAQP